MTKRKRKKLLYKELKLRLKKFRAGVSFHVTDVSAHVKQPIELTFIYAPNGPKNRSITFPEVFKTPPSEEPDNKEVLEVFVDLLSISRGINPPSVNETAITTVYTDGTINVKKESW